MTLNVQELDFYENATVLLLSVCQKLLNQKRTVKCDFQEQIGSYHDNDKNKR